MRGKQIRKTVEIINFCFGIVGSLGVIGDLGKVCRSRGTSFYGINPQMAELSLVFISSGGELLNRKAFVSELSGVSGVSGLPGRCAADAARVFYGANPQMAWFIVGFYFFGRGTFESKSFCFGIVGNLGNIGAAGKVCR